MFLGFFFVLHFGPKIQAYFLFWRTNTTRSSQDPIPTIYFLEKKNSLTSLFPPQLLAHLPIFSSLLPFSHVLFSIHCSFIFFPIFVLSFPFLSFFPLSFLLILFYFFSLLLSYPQHLHLQCQEHQPTHRHQRQPVIGSPACRRRQQLVTGSPIIVDLSPTTSSRISLLSFIYLFIYLLLLLFIFFFFFLFFPFVHHHRCASISIVAPMATNLPLLKHFYPQFWEIGKFSFYFISCIFTCILCYVI